MDKGFKFMTAGEYMSIRESISDEVKYLIEYDEPYDVWSLFSLIDTDFSGPAKNWICSGTKEYCELQSARIKSS